MDKYGSLRINLKWEYYSGSVMVRVLFGIRLLWTSACRMRIKCSHYFLHFTFCETCNVLKSHLARPYHYVSSRRLLFFLIKCKLLEEHVNIPYCHFHDVKSKPWFVTWLKNRHHILWKWLSTDKYYSTKEILFL